MESLETTAEVKSSKEALNKTVPQIKSAAPEPMTAQTKIPPSADSEGEGWHLCPEPEEDQSRTTYCSIDMSDSGKLRQLEGKSLRQLQDQPCSHPHYNVLTSYPPQERQTVPFARQKTADHLLSALPLVSCGGPSPQRSSPSLPVSLQHCSQSGIEELSKEVCSKMEQKQQQRPGKYVCDYCGRACAKPSVLKKHIRSHTGERPYPCVPCGFSFKTKSNLYKHRKSHAHSVKAGTVPFSELGSYNINMEDRGSLEGEGEFYSDAEQSSDTDEDDSSLLDTVSVEEPDSTTAVKVLNLIAQKQGVTLASTLSEDGSPRLLEINAAPAVSQVSHAIQSSAIKQRLALRLSEKRSSDTDTSLSLPSQGSKGSTDSGYFSRSESAEHQTGGPPNTNAKSYQEIMFGKCYKPNPKQQAITVVTCRTDLMSDCKTSERGVSRVFTQEKESMVESIRINTHSFTREDIKEAQLELSDSGQLVRSNSMPTSSVACQDMSQGLRGSHSFDERASPGGIRRLTRQAAFEHSAHDGPPDHYGNISDISNLGVEVDSFIIQQKQAMEYATRKRRKEKCVAEEEDVGGQYHTDYDHSEEMRDYDSKQTSQGALTTTSSVKGHAQSVHTQDRTQRDRLEREMWEKREREERRSLGNVISVIQHTNSLTRSLSEQSDSYNYQRRDKPSSMEVVEQSETREMHKRTEIFAHQLSDSRLLDKSYQMTPKLVRQSNIPVPEIRVTVEPDSPEKEKSAEVKQVKAKEPDRQIEEFQWPQRSETLSQFPPEKLPPKKKRLRLADLEHSSGESSFESACTSLSRSPSQDSNLSYCSSFSFDREEKEREVIPKPASPAARQDEFGKALEFLAVPGSGYSHSVLNQRQQHEMRRTSSEQAPCHSQCRELPEVRSVSFDYGSLSPTAKVRHAELSVSYSEPRRSNLVRQESLNVNLEFAHPVLPLNILPQYLSSALSFSSTALHSQCLPMFSPQPSHSGLLVPVRIQTHVPSYGSITYTTVSQIVDDPFESVNSTRTSLLTSHFANLATNLDTSNILLGHPRGLLTSPVQVHVLDLPPAKLKTGIPLSLTSRTISTTNCGSSGGSNKRMLSPASSLDLFMEVKQQKRVKEEKMYGEIVEELGAVELGNYNVTEENKHSLKSEFQSDTNQGASLSGFPSKSSLSVSSALHSHNEPASGSFVSPQQQGSESPDSPMDNSPTEASLHPHALLSLKDFNESGMDSKAQMEVLVQLVKGQGILISDGENTKRISQFPSLRTMTAVSWCYLNYTKPNSTHSSSPLSSVYATWCISSHNPNPPNLNTSATLALLRSKQTTNTWVYTMAAMYQPGTGKLVSSSLLWRQRLGLLQSKPQLKELEGSSYGRKVKDASCRVKAGKEDWKEREVSSKQTAVPTPTPTPTPTRIKIFEGGFKSNEDYVYVRGRGRGKYICEECGIRCKKPSMLKKHIRTHTDVRPYVCRVCNFAFKTKGNLTKHMKSKAHMKKCLELGVSVTVDDTETLESDDIQQDLKTGVLSSAKHQFSDADDSDGMDEEIDDIDEDDEDEDDYDGDSTPKILSRSTSPQPCGVASLSVTAAAVIQGVSSDVHGCPLSSFHPLPSCLSTYTLPSVDIHPHPTSTLSGIDVHPHPHPPSTVRRTGPDRRTVLASSLDKEDCSLAMLSPDQGCLFFDPYPTCLLSPGWESPLREPPNSRLGYPSTRRDHSPRGRSSPRWDTSPLRPSSPNLTPIQHLFPACMERPLSPGGVDLAGRRQRVVLRAVSPRRGGSQHRDSGDKTRQQAKAELVQQGETIEMDMDQRRSVPPCLPGSACSSCPRQNLFSHLPLHSQQQAGTLLPMVPIGGIQVLRSLPSCSSDRTHLSALSPQKTELHQDSTKGGSVRLAALGAEDSGARQQGRERGMEREMEMERETGMERERLSPLQTPRDSEEENPPVSVLMVRNPKQEEVLQTCTKAIASLRITSEEHL